MTIPASPTAPGVRHAEYGAVILALLAFPAGFAANYGLRAHTYTRTRVTHLSVQQQYGKPSTSVDGAQVNSQLAGEVCDVYDAKRTVICHP